MAKVLVLYYSAYGHVERMAQSVAEGARSVSGTEVTIKRVPELMPEDLARKAGMKLDQQAPLASVDELPSYDAIIFGTPTRFGNMTARRGPVPGQTRGRDRRKAGAGCRRAGSDTEGHAESDGNRRRHGGSALTNCLARPDINPTGHGRVDTSPRARSGSEVSDRVAAAGVHRDRRTGIAGR